MLLRSRPGWSLPAGAATPVAIVRDRRSLLAALGRGAGGGSGPQPAPRREDGAWQVEYIDVGGLVLGFVVAGEAERSDAY